MDQETTYGCVVIVEAGQYHVGERVDEDTALTLLATVSEDPASVDEMASLWPRYRTPVVPEFFDAVALQSADRDAAEAAVGRGERWLTIDLSNKRVCTGPEFFEVGRDQAFAMSSDEKQQQECLLSVHLPPWWELHEQVDAACWTAGRDAEPVIPSSNREVLYGEPLLEFIAAEVLEVVASHPRSAIDAGQPSRNTRGVPAKRYELTKAVHRRWLMTPRDDLGGATPRSQLHGGREWIDRLTRGQQMRCEDGGSIVAIPDDLQSYPTAPMGLEEIVIYFDLCRELIEAAWTHCLDSEQPSAATADGIVDRGRRQALIEQLRQTRDQWMQSPYEDDAPPAFIIECSRRRVPRAPGVPIVGIEDQPPAEHASDCDCPVCMMMSEDFFGPSFIHMDGHHLELEDDFAFSLSETYEQWEAEQMEFESLSDAIDFEMQRTDRDDPDCPEEFQSVWSGFVSDAPLPGDSNGHAKLAFLLCEIIDELRSAGCDRSTIETVNQRFQAFRSCDPQAVCQAGHALNEALEDLAGGHPELVGRIADFQSRVDECLRTRIAGDDSDPAR